MDAQGRMSRGCAPLSEAVAALTIRHAENNAERIAPNYYLRQDVPTGLQFKISHVSRVTARCPESAKRIRCDTKTPVLQFRRTRDSKQPDRQALVLLGNTGLFHC